MGSVQPVKTFKALFLVLLVLACTFFVAGLINNRLPYADSLKLTEGWTVNVNHRQYSDVNLDEFNYDTLQRGSNVILSTTLPDCGIQNPVLSLTLYRASFEVYLDDDLVYEYGMDEAKLGKMVGTGINWIHLPTDLGGKILRLNVLFNEYNGQTSFIVPVISEASLAIKYFISENLSFICIGAFLIVFGVCLLIASIFVRLLENDSQILLLTGLFALFTGFWLLGNKGILNLVSDDRILNLWLEYVSLYAAPLPILLYMLKLRQNETNKLLVLPLKILLLCNLGLLAVALFLQITDILHFTNLLSLFHIVDFIGIAYIVGSCVYLQVKQKKAEENIVLAGVVLLTLCVGFDLVLFNLGKYVNLFFSRIVGISAWGSLFFVISMLLNFGLSMYRNISYKVEQTTLINLAFTDPLTKLANRAKLFRTISDFLKKDETWGIINFDLNYLKMNNDKYGHQTGDAMLKDFARILKSTFTDASVVARVGGDEFYVLYRQPEKGYLETAVNRYEANIDAFNKGGAVYTLSAAYGIAYSAELPNGTQDDVVQLSDSRMYDMKQKMH